MFITTTNAKLCSIPAYGETQDNIGGEILLIFHGLP